MELPSFLLADNTDCPDDLFIIHTEFPRFIWNPTNEDVEWIDELHSEKEEDLVQELAHLLEKAESFYEREMKRHEAEEF